MRGIGLFAAALALAGAGAGALAAPGTGSRIDSAPGSVPDLDPAKEGAALKATHIFSRCVANLRQRLTTQALDLPLGSPEQNRAVRSMIGGEEVCMSGNLELRLQAAAMLGGMAERLILLRHKGADVTGLAAISDAQLDAAGLAPRTGAEDFAMCMVRKDPKAARALIDTDMLSDAEAAQIKRLIPHLGGCLVAGHSVTLNKFAVRTHAAVGLYRLLTHAGKLSATATAAAAAGRK